MIRRILTATTAAIMAAGLCTMVMAQGGAPFLTGQLPKLEITTSTSGAACPNTYPPQSLPAGSICPGVQSSCSGVTICDGNNAGGGSFAYRAITSIKLTVPGNPVLNIDRGSSAGDSIRGRGNSSAAVTPRPYRIKFGSKVGLFNREPNRSWVLLTNHYDGTNALNATAFELGRRLGLHGTPTVQFVELHLKIGDGQMQRQGVYLLTDQVSVNEGRVDIDEEKGWLAEIDFHSPDNTECDSWFGSTSQLSFSYSNMMGQNTTANKCMGFFIKSPEDKTKAQYQFVRDDINKVVTAVSQGSSGWRDLVDFESVAKYLLIQGFMANSDFFSGEAGGPGSNFIYKDHCHTRMYAGPLWDFDLAVGYWTSDGNQGNCGMFCFPTGEHKWSNTSVGPFAPVHPFWKKIWDDGAFQAKLKEIWTAHKSDFQAMSQFSRDVTTHNGLTTNQNNLATWLTNRVTYVDGQINALSGNAGGYSQSPEAPCSGIIEPPNNGPFTLTISVNPTAGGRVYVKVGDAAEQLYTNAVIVQTNNTQVTVRAEANDGYTFTEWGGALTTNMENQKTNMSMTWGISSNRSLIANFRQGSGPIDPDPPVCANGQFALTVNVNGEGTVTVNPQQDCYNSNTSVTLTATASDGNSFVNWAGDISQNTPTNQSITVSMTRARTITANFEGNSSISICGTAAMSVRTRATLRASAKGVTALLPANHGYTSYRLIDLQGREIKSGKIGSGVTDLRISNVRPGVVFLRLDGKAGVVTTLRTTVVR